MRYDGLTRTPLRDLIEEFVQANGRNRAARRKLRDALREKFAHELEQESAWRLRKKDQPRCAAPTTNGQRCQGRACANGLCRCHGGDPLQPMPRPGSEVSIGFDEVKAECAKIKMCK